MKLRILTSLQEKYSFYVDFRTEDVYIKGFSATKTEQEMLREDKQVLELICETIAMKLKSRIEREKKAKVRRINALHPKRPGK